MKIVHNLTFLFLAIAAPAFAADDRITVASLDKESTPPVRRASRPPVVIAKNEYYEVRGCSEHELRSQMYVNGCTWDDGRKYDSVTSWSWTWDEGVATDPRICSPDDFSVTLEITTRYPKWVRSSEAPQPLVEKWDGYMRQLTQHENGHRDMVVDAAKRFSRAVARLPHALNCEARSEQILNLNRDIMAQLNESQVEYDADTDHGATQGALFP